MAQLMPLPLTVSCFSKIRIGFTFLVPAHPSSPGQRAVKRVCVCVCDLIRRLCVTDKQWLQLDIGPPTLITGMLTRGRGDTRRPHWVTRFRLSYSNDSLHWTFYKDATHLQAKVSTGSHVSSMLRPVLSHWWAR